MPRLIFCLMAHLRMKKGIFLLLGVLFSSGLQANNNCPSTGIWLQILGSGGPDLQAERAASSYLIWIDGKARLMIDSGSGTELRFAQSGADFADLDAVLFTHFHVDHSAAFPALIKASFFGQRERDLPVYGPSGNRFLPSPQDFLQRLFADQGVWPYLSGFVSTEQFSAYKLLGEEVAIDNDDIHTVFENDQYRLQAVRAHHGPLPALSWRVDLKAKTATQPAASISFSGDMSGRYHNLPKLAQGTDLLVAHHAIPEDETGVGAFLHMPPSLIGKFTAEAQAKQLVLTHRMQRTIGKESESEAAIRQHYSGSLSFADDLNCFAAAAMSR